MTWMKPTAESCLSELEVAAWVQDVVNTLPEMHVSQQGTYLCSGSHPAPQEVTYPDAKEGTRLRNHSMSSADR